MGASKDATLFIRIEGVLQSLRSGLLNGLIVADEEAADDWIGDPNMEELDALDPGIDREDICHDLGYLQGVADAMDITVLELIDQTMSERA